MSTLILAYISIAVLAVAAFFLKRITWDRQPPAGSSGKPDPTDELYERPRQSSYTGSEDEDKNFQDEVYKDRAATPTRNRDLIQSQLLEGSDYHTPVEIERNNDLAKPLLQPLGTSLFRQDRVDDLTRNWGRNEEEYETFNLFKEDQKDDLTRAWSKADNKNKSFNLLDDEKKDQIF